MAICKDCIHKYVCFILETHGFPENCDHFKDISHFIKLSCKVGDKVYAYCDELHELLEYTVNYAVMYRENKIHFNADAYDDEKDEALSEIDFTSEEIGKTVFLTRKEAEGAKND